VEHALLFTHNVQLWLLAPCCASRSKFCLSLSLLFTINRAYVSFDLVFVLCVGDPVIVPFGGFCCGFFGVVCSCVPFLFLLVLGWILLVLFCRAIFCVGPLLLVVVRFLGCFFFAGFLVPMVEFGRVMFAMGSVFLVLFRLRVAVCDGCIWRMVGLLDVCPVVLCVIVVVMSSSSFGPRRYWARLL